MPVSVVASAVAIPRDPSASTRPDFAPVSGEIVLTSFSELAGDGADVSFVSGFGGLGAGAGQLDEPEGVATAVSGDVYVAE